MKQWGPEPAESHLIQFCTNVSRPAGNQALGRAVGTTVLSLHGVINWWAVKNFSCMTEGVMLVWERSLSSYSFCFNSPRSNMDLFIPGWSLKGGCVKNPPMGHFLLSPHPLSQAHSPHPHPFHSCLISRPSSPRRRGGDFILQRRKSRTNSNTRAYSWKGQTEQISGPSAVTHLDQKKQQQVI